MSRNNTVIPSSASSDHRDGRLVEATFLALSDRWLNLVRQHPGDGWLPSEVERYTLSCLLIIEDEALTLPSLSVIAERATSCAELASTKGISAWTDRIPWELIAAISLDDEEYLSSAVRELQAEFTHHNSGIRSTLMNIGWTVSRHLEREVAGAQLLRNVAESLVHEDAAYGLVRRLYPDDADFNHLCHTFTPPSKWAERFTQRLEMFRRIGATSCQASFLQREAESWRLISEQMARLSWQT